MVSSSQVPPRTRWRLTATCGRPTTNAAHATLSALKTRGEIEAMRAAGAVVADTLAAVRTKAAVGVRLEDLDDLARTMLAAAGASSSFFGYKPAFAPTPYPGVLCLSVNDAVLHGPPSYRLRDGDLLSVDWGATLDGWTGDAAISFCVGHPSADDLALLQATERALTEGIAAARPGAHPTTAAPDAGCACAPA